jgi:hypothetical protein
MFLGMLSILSLDPVSTVFRGEYAEIFQRVHLGFVRPEGRDTVRILFEVVS